MWPGATYIIEPLDCLVGVSPWRGVCAVCLSCAEDGGSDEDSGSSDFVEKFGPLNADEDIWLESIYGIGCVSNFTNQ